MDIKTFTKQLDGHRYPFYLSSEIAAIARSNGYVVIFGAGDDLIEVRGCVYDETGVGEDTTVWLGKTGFAPISDDGILSEPAKTIQECQKMIELWGNVIPIKAIWEPKGLEYSWIYEVAFPHETFDVMDEGKPYCRGIVFTSHHFATKIGSLT